MKIKEELKKYTTFIYDKFNIEYKDNYVAIAYYYEIVGLKKFVHKLEIPFKNTAIDKEYLEKLVFNLGLLELVSYWKATVASRLIVRCGNLTEKQKNFFKKIYYYGLGEFFYVNHLEPKFSSFLTIEGEGMFYTKEVSYEGSGSMIAIGGGKDSCVTLSLYPKEETDCFIINPKKVMVNCALVAGYKEKQIIKIKRMIDTGLLELNHEGYLNGHTPFSAMVSFVSYLTAYLNNKKCIVLSNESSANEVNVSGTKINHQYSKSYEYEVDFQTYAKEFLGAEIKYYSFLRPLTEYQIGMLFAKRREFHDIFKSCNVGSKNSEWYWCCNCAKCLFVFSLLSPYLYKEDLVAIFGENLFEKKELLQMFKELLGKENIKPFDCVGTFEEINYAITKTIQRLDKDELPELLKYYYENYYDEDILKLNLENYYNENNSLDTDVEQIIKEAIRYDSEDYC